MLGVVLLLKIPENLLEFKQTPYFEQNRFFACLMANLYNRLKVVLGKKNKIVYYS